MPIVKLQKVTLKKKDLKHLSRMKKKQFVMLMLMLQDLKLFSKCLSYTENSYRAKNDWFNNLNTTAILTFQNLMISKTFEIYKFIKSNIKVASDAKTKKVITFFEKNNEQNKNLFDFIRSKFCFHYEYQKDIDKLIVPHFEKEDHEIWLSKNDSANEIFPASYDIFLGIISTKMDELNYVGKNKFSILNNLTLEAYKIADEFCREYLSYFIASLNCKIEEEKKLNVPSIDNVKFPLLVSS